METFNSDSYPFGFKKSCSDKKGEGELMFTGDKTADP